MSFGELKSFIDLIIWLKSLLLKKGEQQLSNSVTSRFLQAFFNHGVHHNQIPQYCCQALNLAQINNAEKLAEVLTPKILEQTSTFFGIRQDWLIGASKIIYNVHDFYKEPRQMVTFLEKIKKNRNYITCTVLRCRDKSAHLRDTPGIFVFSEIVSEINNRPVFRHHFCGLQAIGYWKSRADFAARCALIIKSEIPVFGHFANEDWLKSAYDGFNMPEYDYDLGELILPNKGIWNVYDFIEFPNLYLSQLDTEGGIAVNFALNRWLMWANSGVITFRYSEEETKAIIASFEKALDS
jgi:hypothetical protein